MAALLSQLLAGWSALAGDPAWTVLSLALVLGTAALLVGNTLVAARVRVRRVRLRGRRA